MLLSITKPDNLVGMFAKSDNKIFALLLLFMIASWPSAACSLALHDWKLVFYLKIPVSAPFFPLAELNTVSERMQNSPVSSIVWAASTSWYGRLALSFLPLTGDPAALLPMINVPAGGSMLGLARGHLTPGSAGILLGSDQCSIKIAFFSDRNSAYNCHQLVLLQNSRIRAVQPDPACPWVHESIGQSWLSLIFYQMPIPGRTLSLSMYPVRRSRLSIYEDHQLVENLLSHKLLLRRPDLVVDPYAFDFPELPE